MTQAADSPARAPSSRGAVAAYFSSALAIRTADAGSAAAVVLLAQKSDGVAASALLAACITVPHMFGPLSARVMSLVRSPRLALAGSFALFAVLFGGAGLLIQRGDVVPAACALAFAGFLGPIFTGGLSSWLGSLVPETRPAQRRAQSGDSLTYAVSSSVGNSVVGAVATAVSAQATVGVLCALAAVAALLVLRLPLRPVPAADRAGASIPNVLRTIARTKDLRDITIITYGNAFGLGSLLVLATTFARGEGLPGSVGPLLVAATGVGALLTALYFVARPLARDVMYTARFCAVVSGVFIAAAPFAGVWGAAVAFLAVGACQSVLNTVSFAVRRDASPAHLRASVFVTMAGVKIAVSALGLGLAGLVPVEGVHAGFVLAGLASAVAGVAPRLRAARPSAGAASHTQKATTP